MASLPHAPYPRYQYRIVLAAREYLLKFNYAVTLGRWILTIADRDDTADIVAGIGVVYGLNILTPVQHLVPGSLTITPLNPRKSYPTYEDLAEGLERIVYVEP